MTDRVRILHAIASSEDGEFTAADLAQRTGANLATVRTVLNRERQYVQEIGRADSSTRGGRAIRFILASSKRDELIAELRTELSPTLLSLESLPPAPAPVPASMVAAESIITNRLPEAKTPEERAGLLRSAKQYLSSARNIIQSRPTSEAQETQYSSLLSLEDLLKTYEATADRRWSSPAGQRLPATGPIGALTRALRHRVPARADAARNPRDYIELYYEARSHAATSHRHPDPQRLPALALFDAARFFQHQLGIADDSLAEMVARRISSSLTARLSAESLAELGCDPACYRPGVLSIPEAESARENVTVHSLRYHAACDELSHHQQYPPSRVQKHLMALAGV